MVQNLKELMKEYSSLAKKYKQVKMPDFDKLNCDFEIEKIEEKETEYVLRTIRKKMMEKIVNSVGFLEMIMNPVNAPRMYMNCVSSLKQEDMKVIEKMHSGFSELILTALELEVEYSEKGEAEMIKRIYDKWNSIKSPFKIILQRLRCPGISNSENKKEKSYFG